nr:pleckstrin homology domain-containing family G member 5 isoform X1 [Misgurnus anguillicaudatus]
MDAVKSSHPSKGPDLVDVMAPEETASGDKSERQREEEKDTDTADGVVAVKSPSHKMATEKHRYHTIGPQQLAYLNKPKKSRGIDFSTVRGTSSTVKPRGALMHVFSSQGASDKSVAQEDRTGGAQGQVEALKSALESFTIPDDLRWTWGEGEKQLDQSWTDIVHSHASMTKTQRYQQEALWELFNTELTYINKLTIAQDLVLAALSHCHGCGFLQYVTPTMIFSNLPSILDEHRLFWHDVLYPILQEARRTGRPFDPLKLQPGCLQFFDRFPAYFKYCWEGKRNVEFTRRQIETNPQFHAYNSWVESHPQCGRMRLGDMQAKPHQRITKYPLLLKAILKNTEDLPTQNALQRMLNSVNHFLASVNGYLQFKIDELALSATAQRIEGYKIEGLSEEIDKHVRELCCFDLTSPMRGVGPNIIRKQLLDETLKVVGRKDNKELVVLLFTDVLLMTKTQKKSDKLKVVRPPLPLERIHCIELRDGYSFVLVEVGDLGCAVSVCCLSTPSPDSCSSWVSALREAQTNLDNLRKNEANKTLKTTDDTELNGSERPPTQNELTNQVKEDSNGQSESDNDSSPFIETYLKEIDRISINGTQTENEVEQKAHEGLAEKEGRNRKTSKQWEEGELSLTKFTERRVTWNHAPQTLLPDKPVIKNGILGQLTPRTDLSNDPLTNTPAQPDPNNGSQENRRDTLYSQSSEDDQFSKETGKFFRNVGSPRLRRHRPGNLQPLVPNDSSGKYSDAKEPLEMTQNNGNQRKASNASIKPQDTHRVLKLGSIKNNNGVIWNDTLEKSSSDPRTISKPDAETKPKLKAQRSVSVTEISFSQISSNPSPPPSQDSLVPPSPLQHLLQRAKQREKEHGLGKRETKAKVRNYSFQYYPAFSVSPSPLASEGNRETEEDQSVRSTSSGQTLTPDETKQSILEDTKVKWPGWCFDDEEVFDFQDFNGEDWLDQTMTSQELRRAGAKPSEKHEDVECSEV